MATLSNVLDVFDGIRKRTRGQPLTLYKLPRLPMSDPVYIDLPADSPHAVAIIQRHRQEREQFVRQAAIAAMQGMLADGRSPSLIINNAVFYANSLADKLGMPKP